MSMVGLGLAAICLVFGLGRYSAYAVSPATFLAIKIAGVVLLVFSIMFSFFSYVSLLLKKCPRCGEPIDEEFTINPDTCPKCHFSFSPEK